MGFSPTPGRVQVLDLASGPGVRVDRGIAAWRRHPARLRLDGREGHRLRPHPRGGDRPPAPRAAREHGDHRGRHHQPRLPARDPRPPRVQGRRGRHRLARPPRRVGRDGGHARRRRRAAAGRDRAGRRTRPPPSARSFYAYARRGRPEASAQVSRAVEVRHRGQAYRIVVSQLAPAATARMSTATPSRPRSSA